MKAFANLDLFQKVPSARFIAVALLTSFLYVGSAFANIPVWPNWLRKSPVVRLSEPLTINGQTVNGFTFGEYSLQMGIGELMMGTFSKTGEFIAHAKLDRELSPIYCEMNQNHDVVISVGINRRTAKYILRASGQVEIITSVQSLTSESHGQLQPQQMKVSDQVIDSKSWSDKGLIKDILPGNFIIPTLPRFIQLEKPVELVLLGKTLQFDVVVLEGPYTADFNPAALGTINKAGRFVAVKGASWGLYESHQSSNIWVKLGTGEVTKTVKGFAPFKSYTDITLGLFNDGSAKILAGDDATIESSLGEGRTSTKELLVARTVTYVQDASVRVCENLFK